MKKQDLNTSCLQETQMKYKNTNRLKVKRQENICHINTIQKKAIIFTITSVKVDFRTKITNGDKRDNGHAVMIKCQVIKEMKF